MENIPNGTDRIFQLPQDVIERILFFLPAKDAARTSILSKTWLQAWNSLPVFSFRSDDFTQTLFECDGSLDTKVHKYMDAIDKSLELLRNYKVLIKHFKLDMYVFHKRHASRIEQLIQLVNKNYVNELVLHGIFSYPMWWRPSFPLATVVSNSVSVLDIKACNLTPTSCNPKFPCLRKLSLSKVSMDDSMVESLLANSPLLETCSIIDVFYLQLVVLPDLTKLKEVKIVGVRMIFVEATNIQKLHCEYYDKDIDDKLELRLVSCPNLKELSLFGNFTAKYIQELVAKFPSLETLFLKPYSPLKGLRISSQQLKHLTLYATARTPGVVSKEIEIDAPNLQSYNFYLFNIIRAKAASVSINTLRPPKATLNVRVGRRIVYLPTKFFTGLNSYLQLFKYNVLKIDLSFNMDESVLPRVRQASAAPPAYLKRLSLVNYQSSLDLAAFLDCCFWICRPKMISIMPKRDCSTEFIEQFSHDKMISREINPQCCSNCLRKCWRHYLEDIKITKIVGMSNENVQDGHDIALNSSSQSAERCKKLVLELTWKKSGQKRKRKTKFRGKKELEVAEAYV